MTKEYRESLVKLARQAAENMKARALAALSIYQALGSRLMQAVPCVS
jgi:hypothetical protein